MRIDFLFADAGALMQAQILYLLHVDLFLHLRTASPVQSGHRTQDRVMKLHVLGVSRSVLEGCYEISEIWSFQILSVS